MTEAKTNGREDSRREVLGGGPDRSPGGFAIATDYVGAPIGVPGDQLPVRVFLIRLLALVSLLARVRPDGLVD